MLTFPPKRSNPLITENGGGALHLLCKSQGYKQFNPIIIYTNLFLGDYVRKLLAYYLLRVICGGASRLVLILLAAWDGGFVVVNVVGWWEWWYWLAVRGDSSWWCDEVRRYTGSEGGKWVNWIRGAKEFHNIITISAFYTKLMNRTHGCPEFEFQDHRHRFDTTTTAVEIRFGDQSYFGWIYQMTAIYFTTGKMKGNMW